MIIDGDTIKEGGVVQVEVQAEVLDVAVEDTTTTTTTMVVVEEEEVEGEEEVVVEGGEVEEDQICLV